MCIPLVRAGIKRTLLNRTNNVKVWDESLVRSKKQNKRLLSACFVFCLFCLFFKKLYGLQLTYIQDIDTGSQFLRCN